MNILRKISPGYAVAIGFLGIIVGLIAIGYLIGLYPSQEARCENWCAEIGRRGDLEHVYPAAQTAGINPATL